ncbi:transcriptional regulator [Streptomyces cinnamoneus]|uniref:Transcriptional regulator n=1 Tax=Streptomyces cinnamoneus TaxID=53446 RepID=A0A2G1XDW7_STRCJ|nr:helix-turn-helix transcriptional regulator [Streptomyces cinnamoneus]PHQ49412.1 transcriptional regulator [Streptomyces cinnamoneus]PPT14938.1 XRE family transcriptional regulator [Streptomyces cinnamoneus]
MDFRTELAAFLRSRRARLRPEDVGVRPFSGRRRVPGLRREELAELAGVSVDYYIRLEQGRSQNVSDSVLDAVAGALRLDAAERAHLGHLTRALRDSPAQALAPQPVRAGIQVLLGALDEVPAYVLGRRLDILASNRLARVLFGDFDALPAERRNVAWLHFLDPGARERYPDWEQTARDTVAALRMDLGRYPCDDRLCGLLGELSVRSDDFSRLWAEHHVRENSHGIQRIRHPATGELPLLRETLHLPDEPDQALVMYVAEPGSRAQTALGALAGRGLVGGGPGGYGPLSRN